MQSSCEVKQSVLSASHVQIGLPKNSTVWKAPPVAFHMEIVFLEWWYLFLDIIHLGHDGLIIVSSAYRWGKKVSDRGGKRSSLDFSRSGDFSPDQKTKNPSLCLTKPLTTQKVNPKKIMEVSLGRWGTVPCRVATKILSCQVNTTSRWGTTQLGISFGSTFVLFSNESSQGPHSY